MQQKPQIVEPEILATAARILNERFLSKVQFESVEFLSLPERRNLVLRIALKDPVHGTPRSLILKQALGPEQDALRRFSNDWAGLAFVDRIGNDLALTPRFFGGSKEHKFILIEDLGVRHLSLVEPLTRADDIAAEKALQRYSLLLAWFHRSGFGRTEVYDGILRELDPGRGGWQGDLNWNIENAGVKLDSVFKWLNMPMPEGIRHETEHVIRSVIEPGPFTTLLHGDICPDNVFDDPDNGEMKLIDFEGAWVGSALLDATFLRMGMPTCWCAKAIPKKLIDRLEAFYRRELGMSVPAANDDRLYDDAYVDACAFWALRALEILDWAKDQDFVWPSGPVPEDSLWKPDQNRGRSRFISRLQAFQAVSARSDRLPHLGQMVAQILGAVGAQWTDAKPMAMYPAFVNSKF